MQLGLQRKSTLFTLTLLVLMVAGLGTVYLLERYRDSQNEEAHLNLTVFRTSLYFVQDIAQLRSVVSRIAATARNLEDIRSRVGTAESIGTADPNAKKNAELALRQRSVRIVHLQSMMNQDRRAITEALDFLYVRGFNYLKLLKRDVQFADELIVTQALLEDLIELGDTALNSDNPDWLALQSLGQPIMTSLSSQLIAFGELQYQVQSQAVAKQVHALELLVMASIAFLWFFALATILMLFVLRSEVVARYKRAEAEEKAQFLAYYDTLTGLPNRARFSDAANGILKHTSAPVVLLFDLDDFKAVNDLYGHAAGDALLMYVADTLQETIEQNEGVCARLGGDEFAAVLPGPLSSIRIASICEQLIAKVRAPFFHGSVQLTGKISIGIAQHTDSESKPTLSELQKAADTALYRAKSDGKNTYAFYDSELADLASRRREIEAGITDALENDGFSVVLQPQVHMTTGAIYGFESLARLSIDGVAISPGEFISIAESTGQVVDLDLWGLENAARLIAGWHQSGLTDARLSSNLSSLHFKNDEIVEKVKLILERTGLMPERLTLELTESLMLDDIEKVTAILERFRHMGIKIALDDFGTGYSSLSYLRRLSVDIIKIDQSFVRGLNQGLEIRCIFEAIVDIANGLGKTLVVEGIETEEEAQVIRDLKCDIGQGYLFGRPMDIDVAQERLMAEKTATG